MQLWKKYLLNKILICVYIHEAWHYRIHHTLKWHLNISIWGKRLCENVNILQLKLMLNNIQFPIPRIGSEKNPIVTAEKENGASSNFVVCTYNPHRMKMFNVVLIFEGYFLPTVASIWRNSICLIILNDSISLSEFWRAKIVVNVQDVRKKWLWENFLFIHFLKSLTF